MSQLIACDPHSTNYQIQYLPDGTEVKIVGFSKVFFADGEQAYQMQYVTELPIDDRQLVFVEAEQIWQVFKINVEEAGYSTGMVMASEPRPPGAVATYELQVFGWRKNDQGDWERVLTNADLDSEAN